MRVRCILVLTTVPVRIRPRMETMPVKGHFLSEMHHTSVQLSFKSLALQTADMKFLSCPIIIL
jgi:hypothetical protein